MPPEPAVRDAVTVAEAQRLLLPGSRVAGGSAGMHARVTWAASLRSRPPAFEPRGGGEFVLASRDALDSLRQVDATLTVERVLEGLAQAGAVALAVPAPAPAAARAAANALGVPLIEVRDDAPLLEAERGIIALVLNRHNELQARASQLYRQLAQISVEGRGLESIIQEAALATGRLVAFEDAQFRVRAAAAPPGVDGAPADDRALSSADERGRLAELVRSHPVSSTTPAALLVTAGRWSAERYAAPVVTRERLRGFVSICAPAAQLTEFDQLAASRTAAVCALELTKEEAVLAAEQRVQGDLVDELLSPVSDPELTRRRAVQAGFPLAGAFGVIAVAGLRAGDPAVPHRRAATDQQRLGADRSVPAADALPATRQSFGDVAEVLSRWARRAGAPVLVRAEGTEVVAVCQVGGGPATPATPETPATPAGSVPAGAAAAREAAERRLRELGAKILELVAQEVGDLPLFAGASRTHGQLAALPEAATEAREAQRIGRRVYGPGRVVAYADLGLYRVLHVLRDSPELRGFYEQTLGPLVEYDSRTGQNLVETLEAFFTCHGNLSQTAVRLQLHRNSLLYRVGRVQEITGLDLEDPEARLALQVALKARRLLA